MDRPTSENDVAGYFYPSAHTEILYETNGDHVHMAGEAVGISMPLATLWAWESSQERVTVSAVDAAADALTCVRSVPHHLVRG